GRGMTPKVLWEVVRGGLRVLELRGSRHTIFGGAARGSAILRVANSIRSNSCLDMSPSKRRNVTSVASRNCDTRSTTEWASNRRTRHLHNSAEIGHRLATTNGRQRSVAKSTRELLRIRNPRETILDLLS